MAGFLPCPALAFLFCIVGCSVNPGEQLSTDADPATAAHEAEFPWPNQLYAFGTIFSEGQSLRHEFVVRNPLDHPVRLIRGIAVTPCCSSIGPIPDSIPARGAARIPTSFNPPRQSGARVVRFLIETDSGRQDRIELALQAQLVSTWEVASLAGRSTVLPLRRSGTLSFRIVSRRKGDRGRGLPEAISASPPIEAGFSGGARSSIAPDGMVEAARDVEVKLPASDEPGLRRGEVVFTWPEGGRRSCRSAGRCGPA